MRRFTAIALDLLAVVVCLSLIGKTALEYSSRPHGHSAATLVGTKLPAGSISAGKPVLLLVLSEKCQFCERSTVFYKRLLELSQASDRKFDITASFVELQDGESYLQSHHLAGVRLVKNAIRQLAIKIVPTVMLIDADGIVRGQWAGYLDEHKQAELLRAILVICPSCRVN